MGKYDGLRDYLAGLPARVTAEALSFEAVEKLVGELPPSARHLQTFWANNSHTQAMAWRDAGWHVDSVHLDAGRVVFARGPVGGTHAARKAAEAAAEAVTAAAETETSGEAMGAVDAEAEVVAAAEPPEPAADVSPSPGAPAGGLSEASVQAMLVAHLAREGWEIRRVAETATKERGIDILAGREGRTLAVEVKGFPSRGTYADPGRAAEVKPTRPGTQARHWYGQAILKAMLTLDEFPDYEVAIGLPAVPTYRRLYERTRVSLGRAGIRVLFVDERGGVTTP